jgi:sec-independent protein translocase protein TatA
MPTLGPTELILILIIVLLLFGVGRIGKIGGELGSGIKAFREGLRGDDKDNKSAKPSSEPTAEKETAEPPSEEKNTDDKSG